MQTVTIKDHDYRGPTRNPNGEVLEQLTRQFSTVRGPEGLREALKAWGLTEEISPHQARFWRELNEGQKRTVCRMAGTPFDYVSRSWGEIPQKYRGPIWQAIGDIATWGERIKGRF